MSGSDNWIYFLVPCEISPGRMEIHLENTEIPTLMWKKSFAAWFLGASKKFLVEVCDLCHIPAGTPLAFDRFVVLQQKVQEIC